MNGMGMWTTEKVYVNFSPIFLSPCLPLAKSSNSLTARSVTKTEKVCVCVCVSQGYYNNHNLGGLGQTFILVLLQRLIKVPAGPHFLQSLQRRIFPHLLQLVVAPAVWPQYVSSTAPVFSSSIFGKTICYWPWSLLDNIGPILNSITPAKAICPNKATLPKFGNQDVSFWRLLFSLLQGLILPWVRQG